MGTAGIPRRAPLWVGRRQLLVGSAALLSMLGAGAAPAAAPARVGFVSGLDEGGSAEFLGAMRGGLAALGYREPETLQLTTRYANFDLQRLPSLVAELEALSVQVIVSHATAVPIVVRAPRRVPVVYEFSADPVATGIARDLRHPLFNATGMSLLRAELNSKRLELLHEIAPDIRRVAVIFNPLHPGEALELADIQAKATQLGIYLALYPTPNRTELDRALATIADNPPQAIVAFSEGFVVENRATLVEFAMRRGLPLISGWAVMAKAGALFTYGPRLVDTYARTAYFVDRILKGATPAELPIEEPSVLELVVNMKSARALGLSIPETVLARADQIIE